MSAATCWRGRHLNAPRCKSTETETRASEDVGRGARMLLGLMYNSKRWPPLAKTIIERYKSWP